MAYKTKDLKKEALEEIVKNDVCFLEDLFNHTRFGHTVFYERKLNEDPDIIFALKQNRQSTKLTLREKMLGSESPAAWIALYKLLGNQDEYYRLANAELKIKTSGKQKIVIQDGTTKGLI